MARAVIKEKNQIILITLDTFEDVNYIFKLNYHVMVIPVSIQINTIFQFPENIADRRKQNSEKLRELAYLGVTFQVKSIFLQGLLVKNTMNLPTELQEVELIQSEIESLATRHGLDSSDLCLHYAKSLDWASQLVLGFDSHEQFRKNLSCIERTGPKISFDIPQASDFLIDPRNWS